MSNRILCRKIVTWGFRGDYSYGSRYDMILGRYIPTVLVINLNFPKFSSLDVENLLKGVHHIWSTWVCNN